MIENNFLKPSLCGNFLVPLDLSGPRIHYWSVGLECDNVIYVKSLVLIALLFDLTVELSGKA